MRRSDAGPRLLASLYLTHIIVLFAAVYLLRGVLKTAPSLMIAFPLTLLVADGAYRLVETRSIWIGRALEKQIDRPVARGEHPRRETLIIEQPAD
jgi:peptidoglycan/LPS O-acetylase OafA/YrhL